MTTYQRLDSPPIHVEFSESTIDVVTISETFMMLQKLAERIYRHHTVNVSGSSLAYEVRRRPRWAPEPGSDILLAVANAQTGSLLFDIGILISTALTDPDIRAVFQGLAVEIVWALANSGLQSIRVAFNKSAPLYAKQPAKLPFKIIDILIPVLEIAAKNEAIKSIHIGVTDVGKVEIDIDMYRRNKIK